MLASEIDTPFPLDKILDEHLDGAEIGADLEEVSPFSGGFVLYGDAEPILLPSCCGDLGNIDEWKKAAAQRTDSPEMLWVGHPWYSTWFADGRLHIREEHEYPGPRAPRTVRVAPTLLEAAISDANREIDQLVDRLLSLLRTGPRSALASEIAQVLVGRRQ
ncbi:MAG: hypothetical protein R3F14_22160 [Polyangiaceae bacterium]